MSGSNFGLRFIIVGAGMSGVLMGIRLKNAGYHDFTILEKASDVGGTWRENTYPGLHCDVPSHYYCYSFDPNPEWPEMFSSGPEIHAYLRRSAEKFGIMPHIRFDSPGKSAMWTGSEWEVEVGSGEKLVADVLVSATGFLHVPVYPDIPGRENFNGPSFHTACWDHSVSLQDKRIALIGTGSTAVQITCALSGKVKKLKLFQRTAQWVAKIPNPPISEEQRADYRANPSQLYDLYEKLRAETARQSGGAIMGFDPEARRELEENVESNLATVRDPELRRKLTPNFKVGCKRLIMSPSFYEAVQDPSVEVVTDGIDHIEENGIVTVDGTLHDVDLIVFGTGFDPSAFIRPMSVTGANGQVLDDLWAERPVAYRSVTVPHMPNFFMLEGPFSPVGNLSLILVSEWQASYIMKCIDLIARDGVAMAPRADVTNELLDHYREASKSTIWATGGCNSWYQDKEGVPMIYSFSPEQYGEEVQQDPELADYEIRKLSA